LNRKVGEDGSKKKSGDGRQGPLRYCKGMGTKARRAPRTVSFSRRKMRAGDQDDFQEGEKSV